MTQNEIDNKVTSVIEEVITEQVKKTFAALDSVIDDVIWHPEKLAGMTQLELLQEVRRRYIGY